MHNLYAKVQRRLEYEIVFNGVIKAIQAIANIFTRPQIASTRDIEKGLDTID